jgi:hypothetical protein
LNQAVDERRTSLLRLAGVGAVLVLLVGLVIASRMAGTGDNAEPLTPYDPMSLWREATPAQKRATAERLLDELQVEQQIGPQTSAMLKDPVSRAALVEQLVAGLDAGVDQNVMAYVPPGQPIMQTAKALAASYGWSN